MTDQRTGVVAYGSLRDILRALDEEDEFWPDECEREWQSNHPSTSTAIVAKYERLPEGTPAPLESEAQAERAEWETWRERTLALITSRVRPRLAAAVAGTPVLGLLLAGALLLDAPPRVDWASAALDKMWFAAEPAAPASTEPVVLAEFESTPPVATREEDTKHGAIAAFAELAKPVLAAMEEEETHPAEGVYALTAKELVTAVPGETVDLPFEVTGSGQLPSGARIVFSGVPENAALNAGEPQGSGTWVVPVERAMEVKLTTYALPGAGERKLTAELRAGDDVVLARTTTLLVPPQLADSHAQAAKTDKKAGTPRKAAEQRIGLTSEWAVAATPVAPAASVEPAATPSAPDATTAAAAAFSGSAVSDWRQGWTRSSLGGPR